jgi:hypothetical protein
MESSADYQFLVIRDYYRKRAANSLALNLLDPTPAKLKKECLIVCRERYDKRDENALRAFFGQSGDLKTTIQAIERCKTERFKPIERFLKNKTKAPGNEVIELLAWLINFEHRPYKHGFRYDLLRGEVEIEDKGQKNIREPEDTGVIDGTMESPNEITPKEPLELVFQQVDSTIRPHHAVAATFIFILIGAAVVWQVLNINSAPYSENPEQCMYWTGDHYERISCSQQTGDTLKVALDVFKLTHFRKITRPDTLTAYSIGRVYYLRKDNRFEYFTMGGAHPVYPDRQLRILSYYIYKTYIIQLKDSIKK